MVTERNCKPATAKCNLDMIKEFYLFLKLEYGLDRFDPLLIEPSHVRRYLVYLNNELNNSPVTRNRKLSALGSYYLFMECFEYIEEDLNPTLLIRRAKATRSLPVFLNLEEAQSILRVSSFGLYGERNLAIMRLMLQTAIRVEELVKLTISDLDLEERILKVDGKGGHERLVPLTNNTCNALKDYLQAQKYTLPGVNALFLNKRGEPLTTRELYFMFNELCQLAGINKPGLSVRHLRHTGLTLMLQAGADLMALKKLAGHKTLRTTQRYLGVSQNKLREAMKKHPLR
jgi:integrase/recombinase XerC